MQFTKKTAQLIEDRANGYCEFCFYPATEEMQIHHRRPRGMGGSKDPVTASPANGVWVHYHCHRAIEENRQHSLATGYLVHQHRDPRDIPVMMPQVTAFGMLLDDEGGYEPLQEPCAASRTQP